VVRGSQIWHFRKNLGVERLDRSGYFSGLGLGVSHYFACGIEKTRYSSQRRPILLESIATIVV